MTSIFDLFAKLTLDSSAYEAGLDNAEKTAESRGSKIGHALGTIGKVGAAALGVASTAVTLVGKSAIKAGLSFDSAMGEVQATAGKTSDQMEKEVGRVSTAYGDFSGTLREFAQFMGANTAFSATQAAQALNYMALAGYDTQKSMEMLPSVLDMAAAGSMDLALASDMITDTQSALGLSTERTAQMVDEFAKAAATGNTSVQQLGEAFLTVGGLAKEANGGLITLKDGSQAAVDGTQQLEIAFTAMANAGIKGSEAGTHMRNILLKLANPTKDGIEAFEKMGVEIYDAAGNMKPLNVLFEDLNAGLSKMSQQEKLSAIGDIFNARDTASAEALLAAVSQDWDRIGESILNAKGSASEMAKTKLDNLQGDITKFKSALEGAQIAMSDGLTPTLRTFVQFGTNGLSKLTQAFQKKGLTGAMDAFGGILSDGINMLIEKLPTIVEAGAQLLGALRKGLMDNSDKIIDAITEITLMMVNDFVKNQPEFVKSGIEIIIKLAEGITDALPTLVPAIVEAIVMMVNTLTDPENLWNLVEAAIDIIAALAKGLLNAIYETNWLELGWNIISGITEGLFHALVGLLDIVGEIGSSIFNRFKEVFGIASPSKLMRDKIGMNIGLGLAEGLEDSTDDVQEAMDDMMNVASGEVKNSVQTRGDFGVKHSGTIRIEGVNDKGEFVAASEYVLEEMITGILKREARLA